MTSLLRAQGNTTGYYVVRSVESNSALAEYANASNLVCSNLFNYSNSVMYKLSGLNPGALSIAVIASNVFQGGLLLRDLGKTVIGASNQIGSAADFRKVEVVNGAAVPSASNPSVYVCLGTASSVNGSSSEGCPLPIVSCL